MAIEVEGMVPLIAVYDMPASLAFYRDVLGFELVLPANSGDDVGWVLLRLGTTELMLNTAYDRDERPPEPDPLRRALHEDTTLYFGCRDLDGVYAYLRQSGIDATPPKLAWYGIQQLYVKDPDGYLLCFQRPERPAQ